MPLLQAAFCWATTLPVAVSCCVPSATRADTEDTLPDTWLRIHRVRQTYRPGKPLLPWIHAIARRVRVDHYRQVRVDPIRNHNHQRCGPAAPHQPAGLEFMEAALASGGCSASGAIEDLRSRTFPKPRDCWCAEPRPVENVALTAPLRSVRKRQHGVENAIVRDDTVKNSGACVHQHQARQRISAQSVERVGRGGPSFVRRHQRGHLNPEQVERAATRTVAATPESGCASSSP